MPIIPKTDVPAAQPTGEKISPSSGGVMFGALRDAEHTQAQLSQTMRQVGGGLEKFAQGIIDTHMKNAALKAYEGFERDIAQNDIATEEQMKTTGENPSGLTLVRANNYADIAELYRRDLPPQAQETFDQLSRAKISYHIDRSAFQEPHLVADWQKNTTAKTVGSNINDLLDSGADPTVVEKVLEEQTNFLKTAGITDAQMLETSKQTTAQGWLAGIKTSPDQKDNYAQYLEWAHSKGYVSAAEYIKDKPLAEKISREGLIDQAEEHLATQYAGDPTKMLKESMNPEFYRQIGMKDFKDQKEVQQRIDFHLKQQDQLRKMQDTKALRDFRQTDVYKQVITGGFPGTDASLQQYMDDMKVPREQQQAVLNIRRNILAHGAAAANRVNASHILKLSDWLQQGGGKQTYDEVRDFGKNNGFSDAEILRGYGMKERIEKNGYTAGRAASLAKEMGGGIVNDAERGQYIAELEDTYHAMVDQEQAAGKDVISANKNAEQMIRTTKSLTPREWRQRYRQQLEKKLPPPPGQPPAKVAPGGARPAYKKNGKWYDATTNQEIK